VSKTSGKSFRVKASITRNVVVRPRAVAFCLASEIGSDKKSIPVILWPYWAKKRAFSPVPHPEFGIDPMFDRPLRAVPWVARRSHNVAGPCKG